MVLFLKKKNYDVWWFGIETDALCLFFDRVWFLTDYVFFYILYINKMDLIIIGLITQINEIIKALIPFLKMLEIFLVCKQFGIIRLAGFQVGNRQSAPMIVPITY